MYKGKEAGVDRGGGDVCTMKSDRIQIEDFKVVSSGRNKFFSQFSLGNKNNWKQEKEKGKGKVNHEIMLMKTLNKIKKDGKKNGESQN